MTKSTTIRIAFAVLVLLTVFVATASAQSIAGIAKDSNGGVLPGVVVEATSPALIEKSRSVVTDGEGQYKIVDLRPGLYSVSFTLPGFQTVKRQGIELTAGFTAGVNAEMPLGQLAETVVVSGLSSVVDIQNVVELKVVSATAMDTLPSGRNLADFSQVIPGILITSPSKPAGQDVGGLTGERQLMQIHGSRATDQTLQLDGLPYNIFQVGGGTATSINPGTVQEFTYELGAISTESGAGGVRVNIIPKEGGNSYSGTVFGNYTGSSLQSDNLTAALKARGLTSVNRMQRVFDLNPSFGGPVVRDRLWFFGSVRYWGYDETVAGKFYNSTPNSFLNTPDLSRPFITDNWNRSEDLALTWQITPKNKLNVRLRDGWLCACHRIRSPLNPTPESSDLQKIGPDRIGSVLWRAPLTSRLMLDAGALGLTFHENLYAQPGVTPDTPSITELSTGLTYRASPGRFYHVTQNNTFRASLSYVTGSHSFKVGAILEHADRTINNIVDGNLNFNFLRGLPSSVVVWATPYTTNEQVNAMLGLFAQDQWKLKRLTFNMGVRLDHLNASEAAVNNPAGRFVGVRNFTSVSDIPNWTDIGPRLGVVYDLLGNGKTAIKVNISRYVAGEIINLTSAAAPVNAAVNSTTRTWNDSNGSLYPECDFTNPAANGQCGAGNPNFGLLNITTRFDNAVRQGFDNRTYNWETSLAIQQQLLPRMAVNAAYFRRSYGNITVTDNLLVTPADYDPYCITSPVDSRLPGGGGNQLCGLYDVKPSLYQVSNNLVTFASNFGKQTDVYNGVDIGADLRLPRGGMLAAGLSSGHEKTNNCFVINSPQQLLNCAVSPPFLTSVKLQGAYPLVWGVQAAATFQSNPGPNITASYTATNAQIQGSLGRNLAAGANGTATAPLVPPGVLYGDRANQVDVRLSKRVKFGKASITGQLDLYNALNASPVLVENNTFGSAWQQPLYVLPGRLIKVGTQITF
jgi:hypothetical protein